MVPVWLLLNLQRSGCLPLTHAALQADSMAVARHRFVSLDCADPVQLAKFWAAMLGGEIMFTTAPTVDIRTEWVWVSAVKIPDYKPPTWPTGDVPKQIHLDLAVADLEATVAEAERLGARLAPVQPAPDRWRGLFCDGSLWAGGRGRARDERR